MTVSERSTTGLDANVAAALSYVLGFLTGIVFLVLEKDSSFVRFHAMQSLIFFLGYAVVTSVLWAVAWPLMLLLALPLWIVVIVVWVVLIVKAFQGQRFKLPLIGDLAEQQVAK
jgi:uncharacterized membrane protein